MSGQENDGWALVTGASSGIGKALAFELASRNFNLFLTGRSKTALHEIATECRSKFSVKTEVHPADLSLVEDLDSLAEAVTANDFRFEVLVNNAGFTIKGEFAETDLAAEFNLVNVQLGALLKLTKVLLPGMIARERGRILNVGSVYSFAPAPFQSVYSACKAFILSFSAALAEETKNTGVTVTVLCPGITKTEFRKRAGIVETDRLTGSTAEDVARVAIDQTLKGKHLVVPGTVNRAFVFLGRHLTAKAFARLTRIVNRVRGVNP